MARHPLLPAVALTGIASISTAAVLIKLCDDAPPTVIAAARLGLAAAILLPIGLALRGRRPVRIPPGMTKHVILAGALLGAHFFFWISSLKHTSVMSSVVIATTNPIFVGIASFFLFKERMRRNLVVGIVLASIGGATIALADRPTAPRRRILPDSQPTSTTIVNTASSPASTNEAPPQSTLTPTLSLERRGSQTAAFKKDTAKTNPSNHLYGDLLALGGAIMASCYYLVGRKVRGEIDLLSYILPVYAVAALVPAALAVPGRPDLLAYKTSTYIYFLLLAIIPQLIGHGAINWCLRHVSATTVAVFILGEPIGASLLAYFIQGETITPIQAFGAGFILIGVLIASRAETAPAPTPELTGT